MSKFWDYCFYSFIGFLALILVGLIGLIIKMAYDYIPYTDVMHQQYLVTHGCSRTGEFAGKYATAIYKCGDGVAYTEDELRSAGIQSRKENK
jgi:hypothetical protein